MTCLYWRECDTNVRPVAQREGASETAATVHLLAWEKKNAVSKYMYSNNFKIQFSPLWDLEVYINNNTNIYKQFRVIISLFYRCLCKWFQRLGEMKYLWSWLEGGESFQYIAAVSLQRTRGLIVAEFSLSWRLMPQVPPCDSCAQMDLNHHLHRWQHFASICCGVGMQCGTLSWPCGVGQGDIVLCPKASCRGICCFFVVHGIESMLATYWSPY